MKDRARNEVLQLESAIFWHQYFGVFAEATADPSVAIRVKHWPIPYGLVKRYGTLHALKLTSRRLETELEALLAKQHGAGVDTEATRDHSIALYRQIISLQTECTSHARLALLELHQAQNFLAYCNLRYGEKDLGGSPCYEAGLGAGAREGSDAQPAHFTTSSLLTAYRSFCASGVLGPSSRLPANPLINEAIFEPDFQKIKEIVGGRRCPQGVSGGNLLDSCVARYNAELVLPPAHYRYFRAQEIDHEAVWGALMDVSRPLNDFLRTCNSFLGVLDLFDFSVTYDESCRLADPPEASLSLYKALWHHSVNVLRIFNDSTPRDEFLYFKLEQLREACRRRPCLRCDGLVLLGTVCSGCGYNGYAWIRFSGTGGEKGLEEPTLKRQAQQTATSRGLEGLPNGPATGEGIDGVPTFQPAFFRKIIRDPVFLLQKVQAHFKDAVYTHDKYLETWRQGDELGEPLETFEAASLLQNGTLCRISGGEACGEELSENINDRIHLLMDDAAPPSRSVWLQLEESPTGSIPSTSSQQSPQVLYELPKKDEPRARDRRTGRDRQRGNRNGIEPPVPLHIGSTGRRTSMTQDGVSATSATDVTETVYCICNRSQVHANDDYMVCCGNPDCRYAHEGWFHLECLGIKIDDDYDRTVEYLKDVDFYCPGCFIEYKRRSIAAWPSIFPRLTSEQRNQLLHHVIRVWEDNLTTDLERLSRQVRRQDAAAATPQH